MTALVKVANSVIGHGPRRTVFEGVLACGLLAAAIILGGASGAGFVGNAALQMLATVLAAMLLLTARDTHAANWARRSWGEQAPVLFLAALAALVLVQLCPLPPMLWQALPGRAIVGKGLAALGIAPPWMPLSLAPMATMRFGVALAPPLAMLLMVRSFRRPVARFVISALVVLVVLSVVIGAMQTSSPTSPLYFYENTNHESAVGFFANANHFGTLMAITIPLAAGLISRWRQDAQGRIASARSLSWAIFGAVVAVSTVGVALSGSFGAMLLELVAIVGGGLIVLPLGTPRLRTVALLVLMAAVAAVLLAGALLPNLFGQGKVGAADDFSRLSMWRTTVSTLASYGVPGGGFGTFPSIFPLFENPDQVSEIFANHAHNDALEFLLDGGILGALLLVAFLTWFTTRLVAVWSARRRDPIAQGAAVAAAMMLLHSLVDYPLRTAAIATLFAFCIGLVARPSRPEAEDEGVSAVATRHLAA